ncbi:MAG: glycosyltransferase family 4 protein [Gemmatimonadetes bacterium]|nr:glycosyltransferase family 4 protein [Gemmatimonadota bacterium]
MKVVFSNASPNLGGAELMTERLALGFRDRGHEVVLFCRSSSPLHERLQGEIPCEPILRGFDMHPVTVWRCWRALRRHRPHLLLATTPKDPRLAGPAARVLGIPVIMRESLDHPYKDRLHYRIFYGWVPARFIANSESTRRTILGSAPWVGEADITVIYNGIPVEDYLRASPVDLGLPAGAVVVGFVGRFEPRKGIGELAEAWPRIAAAVPNAHLVIAGRGPHEAVFRASLAGVPRVHWLGFREDIPALMRALDILLVPSHWEGFGLVAVEALAAGTPPVVTRASSLPELVADGVEGRLIPVRDSVALADAAIELARDPALRDRMGRAGRERSQREFTVQRMLEQYENIFDQVVKEHERTS